MPIKFLLFAVVSLPLRVFAREVSDSATIRVMLNVQAAQHVETVEWAADPEMGDSWFVQADTLSTGQDNPTSTRLFLVVDDRVGALSEPLSLSMIDGQLEAFAPDGVIAMEVNDVVHGYAMLEEVYMGRFEMLAGD